MKSKLLLLAVILGSLGASDVPTDPRMAHAYADGVLEPRFTAALNEFLFKHPRDKTDGQVWEHVQKSDVQDLERWREVRAAFQQLDKAMKNAGY